jgi:hypothetical protein
MILRGYVRRLRIWETNYGRDAGWVIERDGRRIAVLSDSRWEDMFWDTYRMEIITDDPELRRMLQTGAFWKQAESAELRWRNREFGELAEFAFPAGSPSQNLVD